jgi:DNA-binding phage protein
MKDMNGMDVASYLSADEVRMKMQMSSGFLKFQKWLVIYNLLVDPRPLAEIARHTGLSESSVYRIISDYNNSGPDSIESLRKMGPQAWFEQTGTFSM